MLFLKPLNTLIENSLTGTLSIETKGTLYSDYSLFPYLLSSGSTYRDQVLKPNFNNRKYLATMLR